MHSNFLKHFLLIWIYMIEKYRAHIMHANAIRQSRLVPFKMLVYMTYYLGALKNYFMVDHPNLQS